MTTPTDDTPSYAPGWYPDVNAPGTERWYDGNGWTQQTRVTGGPGAAPVAARVPVAAASSAATAKKPWFKRKGIIIPVGIVAGLIVISSIGSALGGGRSNTAAPDVKDTPAAVAEQPDEQEPEEEPEPEPEMVAVPADLVGMTADEAADALEAAGLEADFDGDGEWKVLEVDASGEVEVGTAVALTLDEPPALTLAQENVIEEAQRYVDVMAFSRRGLFDQLTSEYGGGYEDKDAKFALDYLEDNKLVNWKKEAVEAAEQYLDAMSFSRSGLLQQLTSEYGSQFTKKQAEYALEQVGY